MAVALDKFVKQLEDSGIVAPGKLENFIPPKAAPTSAEELAQDLVKAEHLTPFQSILPRWLESGTDPGSERAPF